MYKTLHRKWKKAMEILICYLVSSGKTRIPKAFSLTAGVNEMLTPEECGENHAEPS